MYKYYFPYYKLMSTTKHQQRQIRLQTMSNLHISATTIYIIYISLRNPCFTGVYLSWNMIGWLQVTPSNLEPGITTRALDIAIYHLSMTQYDGATELPGTLPW